MAGARKAEEAVEAEAELAGAPTAVEAAAATARPKNEGPAWRET